MDIDVHRLWDVICAHQGEMFYTASKLPFTYTVRGGEMFTDRKKKSITRASFERAFEKIQLDFAQQIVGPKTLGVFGAPYVWAVFAGLGLVHMEENRRKRSRGAKGQMTFLPDEQGGQV